MDEKGIFYDDLDAVFGAAVELATADERAAYLDRACADDPGLRRKVEKLLDAHARADGFMRDSGAPVVDLPDTIAAPASEKPGAIIGPYKLLQVIGEGGMGSVYLAEQKKPVARRVALKIIKPGMDSGEIIARFEAERQALALMDHPGIAKVFDAGATEKGRPYFVMELVKGIPITEYCDQHEFSPRQRLELFVRVCQAVQHAHQKGIIHRDLKPDNVLVASYDDKAVPKVIDFGVAKATGPQLTEKTMYTQYGQLVGTLEYMSPEQADLTQLDIDTRSDIYALGVLLYELLAGARPFDRGRLQVVGFDELLRIIREEEPPRPSTRISTLGDKTASVTASRRSDAAKLRRDLRGELDWIVMRAMEKDRNRRYESASAFAADIERFLRSEPVHACPPSTSYRMKKFVRRNRGLVTAAAVVLLVLILGLIGTGLGLIEAGVSKDKAVAARDAERLTNCRMALDRGLVLCDDDHVGEGMLWLARALKRCPSDAPELERVIRANLNAWHRELNAIEAMFAHDGPVISVAVSPSGDRIATGSSDHTAQVWNVGTGERIGQPWTHDTDVHELAFSSDGKLLLAADYRKTAVLWDTRTGERVHVFDHAKDASPREIVGLIATGGVLGAAFRPPDDAQVVTSCGDGSVRIWDVRSGECVGQLPENEHMIHDVAVSPDGRWILTASHDSTATLWDFDSRERLATFRHGTRVPTAAFLGDGSRIVTGTADGNVYVWSVADALEDDDRELGKDEYIAGPWRHHGTVHRLRVSPDGTRVLSASIDNTARCWDPERNAAAGPPFEHQAAVQSVAFFPKDPRVAIACDDNITRLWRPAGGQSVRLRRHEIPGPEPAYTTDGRYILIKSVGPEKDLAVVRDAATGQVLCTVRHPGGLRSVAVSPDRSMVLTGGAKNDSRVFSTTTGELVHGPFQHHSGVWSVTFSADGRHMLAGGFGGAAQLRDARTGELVRELQIGARVQGLAFSPVGARFAVACGDKKCRIFSLDSELPALALKGHQSAVSSVAFSRDGQRIVTGSQDNTVRVWDAATRDQISKPMRHRGPIWYSSGAAFSPDGSAVVTGCDDKTVRVWDVATSRPVGPALEHETGVRMVAFTSDREIRTGSTSGAVRFWEAERSPLAGDVERVTLWVEVITGHELGDDGSLSALDGARWQERRVRLLQLGGAPTGG